MLLLIMGLVLFFSKNNQGDSGQDPAGEKPVVSLAKSSENLDKVLVSLSKESRTDMSKHTAMAAVAVDYSGSMEKRFMNGSVQRTVTRLFPLALKFDDDGKLESWLFSNGSRKLETGTIDNYESYVANVMLGSGMEMGGTNYAPVLRDIIKYYKKHGGAVPAFITDGDNSDRNKTDEIIKELSHYNMFVQFVGIGKSKFEYLHALDDMGGRECDNTGFISVSEMDKLDDETLYTELLSQYRDWLDRK